MARLLAEVKGDKSSANALKINNQLTITLSRNHVFYDHSKHIDVRFHYIHECVEEDKVQLQSIGMMEQLADILTKALGREHFCELRSRLGLSDVQKAH